jgi:hypothetical protein
MSRVTRNVKPLEIEALISYDGTSAIAVPKKYTGFFANFSDNIPHPPDPTGHID